jgi:hypothetical protein
MLYYEYLSDGRKKLCSCAFQCCFALLSYEWMVSSSNFMRRRNSLNHRSVPSKLWFSSRRTTSGRTSRKRHKCPRPGQQFYTFCAWEFGLTAEAPSSPLRTVLHCRKSQIVGRENGWLCIPDTTIPSPDRDSAESVLTRRCISHFAKVRWYSLSYKSAADEHSRLRYVHVNSCKLTAISDCHVVQSEPARYTYLRSFSTHQFSQLLSCTRCNPHGDTYHWDEFEINQELVSIFYSGALIGDVHTGRLVLVGLRAHLYSFTRRLWCYGIPFGWSAHLAHGGILNLERLSLRIR